MTQPTLIDTLALDAALTETGVFRAQVSDHPVETGANVVDHIRPQPIEVRIDGVVTDTPTTPEQVARAGAALGVSLGGPQLVAGRSGDALAFLLALHEAPRLVTIVTKSRTYEQMALVDLTVPQDRTTGSVLRFSASFRQVRTVTLRRVVLRTATPSTKRKRKEGTKPTKTATPALQNKSIAKKIADSGAGDRALRSLGVR